jgi:hypothetical protein
MSKSGAASPFGIIRKRHHAAKPSYVVMPDQCSELVEFSKLNGDFRRNYGKGLGAILYLRSG